MNKHIPGKDGRINVYQMACKKLRLVDNNDARSLRHLASLRGELFVLQSLRGLCPYLIEYIEHYCLRYRKGTEMLLEASIYMGIYVPFYLPYLTYLLQPIIRICRRWNAFSRSDEEKEKSDRSCTSPSLLFRNGARSPFFAPIQNKSQRF